MKSFKSFISGALAMALALSLVGSAVAAAGKLEIGTAGVVILDKVKVEPGAEYAANGTKIPAVVTYQDPSGKTHSYIPVEMLTDFLNIPTSWSEKRNSVVLGVTMENAELVPNIYPGGKKSTNPTKATLGQKVGPFTEIAPQLGGYQRRPHRH